MAPHYQNEDAARAYLEARRWPEGPVCPSCGTAEGIYALQANIRPGVYRCGVCRQRFTVTFGTIFERSRIPLHVWLRAIHEMRETQMTVLTLQRALELSSFRTAFYLFHRLKWAMTQLG